MIAAMTAEERAAMGLPEVGWEKVVWGGIGLEEDDDPGGRRTSACRRCLDSASAGQPDPPGGERYR
jgi:hypothetical protein